MVSSITPDNRGKGSHTPDCSENNNDKRWYSLLRILQHKAETIQELLDYTLNEAIALTESKIGFIYRYDDQGREFVLNSRSGNVMSQCSVADNKTRYNFEDTGLWGEAVRQGKPIVVNDFQLDNPLKKGSPEGHVALMKFMTLPVYAEGKIVAVIGVANKETDYDKTDIIQLQLLMDAVWKVVEQKSARESENKLRIVLQERVKELKCLSALGEEMHRHTDVKAFCMMLIGHLTSAMSYPESSYAEIKFKKQTYSGVASNNKTSNFLEAEIWCTDKKFGTLKVYTIDNVAFLLPEEQNLINQVANLAGLWFNRREIEESLRQREEDLYITLRSIGDGVIATDTEGRIVKMNPVAEKLSGWDFTDVSDKYLEDLFPMIDADSREKIVNPVRRVLDTGEIMGLANHTLLICKDGSERHIADSAAPILDDHGNLRGVVFVFSDVTLKFNTLEQLRKSEVKFRQLAERTETILWEYDISIDSWTYVAPQVERILGYKPSEWTNYQFWLDHLHEKDRGWAHLYCNECTKNGEDHVFEYRFLKKDGSYAWLLDEAKVETDNGIPVRLWGSIRDITSVKLADEAIRESEEKYRVAFKTSPDAISITTLEGYYVDINESFTRITGYTRDDLIGKLSTAIGIWSRTGDREKLVKGIREDGYVENLELIYRLKDGRQKTAIMSASIILIDEKPHILTISRDITERKRIGMLMKIQYRIAHSVMISNSFNDLYTAVKQELSVVFDTSNLIIALYDEKTGMLSSLVESSELPFSSAWPADKSLTGIMIKQKKPLLLNKDEIRQLAASGLINLYGSRAEKWLGVPISSGGAVIGAIIIQSYTDPHAYDDSSVEFLEAVADQLSSYIQRKNEQEKAIKLSRAVEQSPASIVITDIKSKIEYVNPRFLELTGYPNDEIIGQNPRILQSGRHKGPFYKDIYDTVLSGRDWQGELLNKKKNGELFWESALISPVYNSSGQIINFIGIKEDITEKKNLIEDLIKARDKAEESDRIKSAFLANMSHEIRTPMNSIVGFSSLLRKTKLNDEKKRSYIEIINSNADHLLNLIEDLLDISQIETGNIMLFPEEVDLYLLFEKLHTRFQSLNSNIELTYSIEDVPHIMADQMKLNQILSNLIGNAMKFTPEGSVDYSVKREGDMLEFKVQDTGTGILKEDIERIFDRFTQGANRVWLSRSGTGLGLALVRAFVSKMGGTVWVESEHGKGSTFWFTLPVRPPEDQQFGNYSH